MSRAEPHAWAAAARSLRHGAPDGTAAGGSNLWGAALSLALLPLLAHFSFSSLGFNPTDDGFILAYSRRLLDGQVPHLDFISIRPVGAALLHMPSVWLGGQVTFWIDRLVVWFEFAMIAWAWTRLVRILAGRASSLPETLLATWIAFVLTCHTFPVMPWHTVDGLALVSAGALLAMSPHVAGKAAGYFLLGAAALCKQNFLPVAPAAVLILGDHRRWPAWAAAIAPLVLYAGYLATAGAAGSAWHQLGSQTDLLQTGVVVYVRNPYFHLGLALGLLAMALSPSGRERGGATAYAPAAVFGTALSCGLLLCIAVTMNRDDACYAESASFLLFGAALAGTLALAWARGWRDGATRAGTLALVTAWSASISVGYNTPALAAGPLAAHFLERALRPGRAGGVSSRRSRLLSLTGVGVACAFALVWITARLHHIYRERPASELTCRLDDVLPGGRLLRTNRNTYQLLADLRRAVAGTGGRPHAIVVDFPGYWAKAPERNPLSVDWPQPVELNQRSLMMRVIGDLEALRGRGRVIVQKVYVFDVANRFVPLDNHRPYNIVATYVRQRFRKTGETDWFEIYE
jgi:hypothetical protein